MNKTIWSVEIEANNWDDDLFNGTFNECLEYCKNEGYKIDGEEARLALVTLDAGGCCIYCNEITADIPMVAAKSYIKSMPGYKLLAAGDKCYFGELTDGSVTANRSLTEELEDTIGHIGVDDCLVKFKVIEDDSDFMNTVVKILDIDYL